ncbi:hypothetical protein O181_001897 [Austropuccinia psidii MF-1]|uniref:Zn(2)-C6 fungal-type domain-containing protein n=1 Tax=Austropuccinia psidii MF-1 TaxID=1389203 RepID=A0A9Q3BBR5_9BASI|nr:hypothetical protein [Austropuccinia psidii MF-1]
MSSLYFPTSLQDDDQPSTSQSEPLRRRQRISRACDACRKNKVKCHPTNTGSCKNCASALRPCTFEAVGVKRERPPTKRDIEQLKSRIQSLEKLLTIMVPNIDLKSLPRTADQAKSMASALSIKPSIHQPDPEPHLKEFSSNDISNPDDVFSALCLLADLHISFTDHDSADQHLNSTPPSQSNSDSPNQNFPQYNRPQFPRSVAETFIERSAFADHLNAFKLPPSDLSNSLISLFFEKVNAFEHILHQPEFMRLYESGVADKETSFRALCFAIFSAASRFSSDPRVLPQIPGESPTRQAAGAMFLLSSIDLITCGTLPCTLYDLQAMALLSYVTCCTCSPLTAWFSAGSHLRRAQDVGAHRENAPQWKTSLMRDQLRKKAVWYLACQEIRLCMSLGRASCLKHDGLTLEFPLCVDDETLSKLCRGELPGLSYSLSPTDIDKLPASPSQVAQKASYSAKRRFGLAIQKLFAVKSSPNIKVWDWDQAAVAALAHDMQQFFDDTSPEAKWDPIQTNVIDLIATAQFTGFHLTFQILLHRLLITDGSQEILICVKAATELIDILDHLCCLGLLELTAPWSPYMITPSALTLLCAACATNKDMSSADQANAWVGVHRCINILNALGPISFLAERLCKSLGQLVEACINDELFSTEGSGVGTNSRKRLASEELFNLTDLYSNSPTGPIEGSLNESTCFEPLPLDESAPTFVGSVSSLTECTTPQQLFNIPLCQLDASLLEHPGAAWPTGNGPSDLFQNFVTPSENLLEKSLFYPANDLETTVSGLMRAPNEYKLDPPSNPHVDPQSFWCNLMSYTELNAK